MQVEEILKTVTDRVATMISTRTVIGESITVEGKGKAGDAGTGSGGGAGAVIQPVAFLVVSREDVRVFSVTGKGMIAQLSEVIPEIMEKYRSIREESRKEEVTEI